MTVLTSSLVITAPLGPPAQIRFIARGAETDDLMVGGSSRDGFNGLAGDDVLRGLDGGDLLIGGDGDDLLDGGDGFDAARFSDRAHAFTFLLSALSFAVGADGQESDRLVSIERIIASAHGDTLLLAGDYASNVGDDDHIRFRSGAGNDSLRDLDPLAGPSLMAEYDDAAAAVRIHLGKGYGRSQSADADARVGVDRLVEVAHAQGGAFDDHIFGDGRANHLVGFYGDDRIHGGDGDDLIEGDGALVFFGVGEPFDPPARAPTNDDVLHGGAGDDRLIGGAGEDVLEGGAGDDRLTGDFTFNDGFPGADDILIGGAGDDVLLGGAGDDALIGGRGDDRLDGESGFLDTADYSNAAAGIVTVRTGQFVEDGDGGRDNLANIERIVGSAFDDILIAIPIGSGSFGVFAFPDILVGGPGDDLIEGRTDGLTSASYFNAGGGAHVDLQTGEASDGDGGTDSLIAIANVYGGAFDDVLRGDDADNAFRGRAGDDVIDGRGGRDRAEYDESPLAIRADLAAGFVEDGLGGRDRLVDIEVVRGTAFDDVFIGGDDDIAFQGEDGDDVQHGGRGDDTLDGGDGDDVLIGGLGDDILNGGNGQDTASYADAGGAVLVDLTVGAIVEGRVAARDGDGGVDLLSSIDIVIGSRFDDAIFGSDGSERIDGGAGDDVIEGRGRDDVLIGGLGDDRITGRSGGTVSYEAAGGAVVVDLAAGTADDGDGGTDTLSGLSHVLGSAFDDRIDGDDLFNHLHGGDGDDVLRAGAGFDRLEGGRGDDTLVGGADKDRALYENAGGAVVVDLAAGAADDGDGGTDTLLEIENATGSDFDDILIGDAGDNALDGGAGDDVLIGGAGDDILVGGNSFGDTVSYASALAGVVVDLDAGEAQDGEGGLDRLSGLFRVIGSAFDDQLAGGRLFDTLIGGAGDDLLFGADFDDRLIGGLGDDRFDGGAQVDLVDYSAAAAGVVADLASGVAADGDGGVDSFINVEDLLGSAFDDRLTGDALANALDGGAGDDALSGGAGDDVLTGGAGEDALAGGDGDDVLDGGDGVDLADYSGAAAAVSVNLEDGLAVSGTTEDTLASIENVIGSAFDDRLTGDDGVNELFGGDGVDRLTGGGGSDRMAGGAGNDIYAVQQAGDVVIETPGGGGNDRINAFVDFVNAAHVEILSGKHARQGLKLIGHAEGETIVGSNLIRAGDRIDGFRGDDLIYGLVGDDILNGGAGDDRIFGHSGNDVIRGGAGDDRLHGQQGFDVFIHRPGDGADVIVDFGNAADKLDLRAHNLADFNAFRAVLHSTADGAFVDFGADGSILLLGFETRDLNVGEVLLS